MTPDGWRIRGAREMVGMSQDALGKAAHVGLAVAVHAELLERAPPPSSGRAALRAALEARGIVSLWENGGTGAQLR